MCTEIYSAVINILRDVIADVLNNKVNSPFYSAPPCIELSGRGALSSDGQLTKRLQISLN